MKWIIGLGNPGEEYIYTRHNVGFLILDQIHVLHDFSDWSKDKYLSALVSVGTISGAPYTLIKPQTFMNLSGKVLDGLFKEDVQSEDIIIIYDDLAFAFGTVRLAHEKGDGGHNGIKSITAHAKDRAYLRVRIGIHSLIPGSDERVSFGDVSRADFVLKEFRPDEREYLPSLTAKVLAILSKIETEGVAKAMTEFNQRS